MRPISLVPLAAGFAWLAFKAEYLGMDAPDGLKSLIVSPGALLLVLAAAIAFPDSRRRVGASLLVIGLVGLFWLTRAPYPSGGWTFYTPYSSFQGSFPEATWAPLLKGPSPVLAAVATVLPFLGLTVWLRRSVVGGILLGASLWCALCLSPSHWSGLGDGMPRRYHYYYLQGDSSFHPEEWDRSDAALPILLGLGGAFLTMRPDRRRGETASSARLEP